VASFVAFRFLVGVGEGGAFPTATRAFTWWLPVRERGFAQGLTHSFARLGSVVTPPIVVAIGARYGWRMSFFVLGAASAAWTVVWLFVFTDTPDNHRWITPLALAEIRDGGAPARGVREATPWKQIINRMWLVTLVDFCYGWSLWVFLTWLPSYLSDARGFKLGQLALMTTLPAFAGMVGDLTGGLLSDGIFRRTGDLRLARRAVIAAGLGGASLFMVPAVVAASALTAVMLLAGAFFFLELTNAALWSLALDIAGEHAGTAGGIMNTGFGVAGMISPVVVGALVLRTGGYEYPLLLSAALLLLGAICSWQIDPTATLQSFPASRVPA
jgi:ACS family D-galactonate transporter-like MFS transporter